VVKKGNYLVYYIPFGDAILSNENLIIYNTMLSTFIQFIKDMDEIELDKSD
jgi:energy-converting hydrogenase Eha subunit H